MGWLWTGRGKPRSRPRVARAIEEAREAHTGAAGMPVSLGGATAVMERAIWTHEPRPGRASGSASGSWEIWDRWDVGNWSGVEVVSPAPVRRRDFGEVGLLLERAEDTARKLGRSRAEMWEEALRAWLDAQPGTWVGAALDARDGLDGDGLDGDGLDGDAADGFSGEGARSAPRPWLFEARRQRIWGEIDETLGTLRSA